MTVNSLARPEQWICQWFVGNKLEHGTFHVSALTETDPNNNESIATSIYNDKN